MNLQCIPQPCSFPLSLCSPAPVVIATWMLRSRNQTSHCISAHADAHTDRLKFGKGKISQFPENWAVVQPFSTGPWYYLQCLGSSFPESCVSVESLGHHSYLCYFAGGKRRYVGKGGNCAQLLLTLAVAGEAAFLLGCSLPLPSVIVLRPQNTL